MGNDIFTIGAHFLWKFGRWWSIWLIFFFRRIESTPPQSDSAACLRQPLKHARTLFALAMGSVLPAAKKPEASMMTTETSKKVVYIISAKVRLYFRNLEQRFVKHYSPMDVLFNFRFLTVDSHLLLRFARQVSSCLSFFYPPKTADIALESHLLGGSSQDW